MGTIEAFKDAAPALVLPAKFLVAFPLVYHYLGGLRHVIWDKAHYGNMARALAFEEGVILICAYLAVQCWRLARDVCKAQHGKMAFAIPC